MRCPFGRTLGPDRGNSTKSTSLPASGEDDARHRKSTLQLANIVVTLHNLLSEARLANVTPSGESASGFEAHHIPLGEVQGIVVTSGDIHSNSYCI